MKLGERTARAFFALVAGILLGNVGWVFPSAVAWGGFWNITACFIFPAVAAVFIVLAVLVD
jgi:hypothetical protein